MPGNPSQYDHLMQWATAALAAVLVLGAFLSGIGVYCLVIWSPATGLTALLAGAGLAFVGVLLHVIVRLLHKVANSTYRTYTDVLEAVDELHRQSKALAAVAENSTLSDWAKGIVYRDKDIAFLRDMIHGAVIRQEWDAAERLIGQMEAQLGRVAEAAQLRQEVLAAQDATTEEKVGAALQRFETLCTAGKWTQAREESQRLAALFPDDERIRGLARELELRRQQRKRHLLQEYDRALHVQDMERAHNLLVELDLYLTPNEVTALKDSARGVFKARLLQMGAQFSLAVSAKKYREAFAIGEDLIREFPNTRYAREIADTLPNLRQRAQNEAQPLAETAQYGP